MRSGHCAFPLQHFWVLNPFEQVKNKKLLSINKVALFSKLRQISVSFLRLAIS
jgi:hypothetical protein